MQDPSIKSCPICEAQNNLSAQVCQACGARFSAVPPSFAQASPKWKFPPRLLLICGIVIVVLGGLRVLTSVIQSRATTLLDGAKLTPAPTPLPTSTLNAPADVRQSRSAQNKEMPAYAEVTNMASKLGFQLGNLGNNGGPVFMAEATRFIAGQEFRFVVIGPARDRVNTIRIQAWGFQTKQARQQLEKWATEVLASLNRGQLPRDFVRQLYAGANVGDDGVSNGFCNVQVLQRPSNPGVPSANDRITIDLIFDKTN
jgi:hypothetical protein